MGGWREKRASIFVLFLLVSHGYGATTEAPWRFGLPWEMARAPDREQSDPLNPPIVFIPRGTYTIGWDRRESRLETAWPDYKQRWPIWNSPWRFEDITAPRRRAGTTSTDAWPRSWPALRRPMSLGQWALTVEDYAVGGRRIGRSPMRAEIADLPSTRTVSINAFLLAKYEVSRFDFITYCKETGRKPPTWEWRPGGDAYPVEGVSWLDAADYCEWLRRKTGRPFRLPTSDEWEIAAQGKMRSTFPWGDEFPARFSGDMVSLLVTRPNAFGVYHMAWYAAEWCRDQVPGHPTWRYVRGGFLGQNGWTDIIYFCSYAAVAPEETRWFAAGFRLALDVPTSASVREHVK